MSKDMLGSVVRATVGVPQGRLELLARIASDLASDNTRGDDWHALYVRVREQGLPIPEFEYNEHGHILLTVTGLNLTGQQEIEQLAEVGFHTNDWAKSCLLSKKKDGYDKIHRLVSGQQYNVALMPTWEIDNIAERTTENLRKRGIEKYGYSKPLAGIAPLVRKTVSDKQMEKMGFMFIATPHNPIKDSDGTMGVLTAYRFNDERRFVTRCGNFDYQWGDSGAFAFLVPAS